ncbi:Prophage CP4-57 regulatory protein (AlpA) [compost metagenome]
MPTTCDPQPRRPTQPKVRIYRLKQVMEYTGFGRAWIYALIAKGEFPKPRKIGSRAVGWPSDLIDQWINDRLEGRHKHSTPPSQIADRVDRHE